MEVVDGGGAAGLRIGLFPVGGRLGGGARLVGPSLLVVALGAADVAYGVYGPRALVLLLPTQALPLLWRHTAPRAVLAFTLLTAVAQLAVIGPSNAVLGTLVALAAVVRSRPRRDAAAAAVIVFVALSITLVLVQQQAQPVLVMAGLCLAMWWFGRAQQVEEEVRQTLLTRVDRLEADRQLAMHTAVLKERLRIGEELHHVVGRALDAVVIRAAVARTTLAAKGPAEPEIAAIEGVCRRALADLDRLLQLLRPVEAPASRRQQPAPVPRSMIDRSPLQPLWTLAPTLILGPIAVLAAVQLPAEARVVPGVGVLLAVGITVPLLLRRRYPVIVAWVAGGLLIVSAALFGTHLDNAVLAVPVGAHAVAVTRPPRTSAAIVAVLVGTVLVGIVPWLDVSPWSVVVVLVGLSVLAWRVGISARVRRVHLAALRERTWLLERERALRVERALTVDRMEMAREVHDSAGHALSVVVLLAGAARSAADRQPARALEALTTIESSARSTLADMDRIIEVFPGSGGALPPRLADLPALGRSLQAGGLEVQVELDAPLEQLPDTLQASAYRIAQEALTNVVKHSDARRCSIGVRVEGDRLVVEVIDDGRARADPAVSSGGRGTVGMRERAELFGGRLDIGSRSDDGYRVRATFPLDLVEATT